jgi:DNA-directed RNA polymerase subunit RPC12/RpoP
VESPAQANLAPVTRRLPEATTYEVDCPHCGKTFTGELISGATDRHQGFKCPHCRLFVAFARADEQDRVEPQN